MNKVGTLKKRSGQALIEWIVFGASGLIVWAVVLNYAKKNLDHTLAESLSVFAARKSLSKERMYFPEAGNILQQRKNTSGFATAHIGQATVSSVVKLPSNTQTVRDQRSFNLLFSGFRSF